MNSCSGVLATAGGTWMSSRPRRRGWISGMDIHGAAAGRLDSEWGGVYCWKPCSVRFKYSTSGQCLMKADGLRFQAGMIELLMSRLGQTFPFPDSYINLTSKKYDSKDSLAFKSCMCAVASSDWGTWAHWQAHPPFVQDARVCLHYMCLNIRWACCSGEYLFTIYCITLNPRCIWKANEVLMINLRPRASCLHCYTNPFIAHTQLHTHTHSPCLPCSNQAAVSVRTQPPCASQSWWWTRRPLWDRRLSHWLQDWTARSAARYTGSTAGTHTHTQI